MRKKMLVTVLGIVAYLFAGFAFVPILRNFCESDNIVAYGAFILGAIVAIIIAGSAYEKWYEEDWDAGILPFSMKAVVFGTVASFAIASIVSGTRAIAECFVHNDLITAGNVGSGFADWSGLEVLVLVLATGMFGPIAEELIFRGLLMNSLWQVFDLHKAAIISAICFGLLHGNSVITIASAMFMGVALAYTYAINRNLLDSIIAHLIYNTFVTYMAVHSEMPKEQAAMNISEVLPEVAPLMLMSILILILLGWIYKKKVLNSKYGWRDIKNEDNGRKM